MFDDGVSLVKMKSIALLVCACVSARLVASWQLSWLVEDISSGVLLLCFICLFVCRSHQRVGVLHVW
jgi:hypothetical protein